MMICLQLLKKFETNCQNQSDYSHLLYLFIIKNLKAIEIFKRYLVSSKLEFFLPNNVLRFCTHFLSREIYMNLLSFCKHTIISLIVSNSHGIYYDFTIFFAKSLWIHFLSSEFPMNSLSVYRIYNGPNIHYGSIIFLWVQYKLTIFFANIHQIHYH